MAERDLPQSVRDAEYAEFQAENIFEISELAQPIFLVTLAYYSAFLQYNPDLGTAAILGAGALIDKFLHGKFHQVYKHRREIAQQETFKQTEAPIPINS